MKTDNIVIVGGGSAGWMTAATLIKSFPNKNISVVEPQDIPIIGVGESTLQSIKRWSEYIGIDEKDFFSFTDASYKLSIKFTDFYKKDSGSFYYPFGYPMIDNGEQSFNNWQLKKYLYPETETNDFVRCMFASAPLFENNKFSLNENGILDNFDPKNDVAYHFDATKFGLWLKERYCLPRGVKVINSSVTKIFSNQNGIEKILLENNEEVFADLYVDCTGFKALLIDKTLNEPFISLENMLPNNSAWATRIEYKDKELELEGFTNCTAIENGWCWNIPLWSRLGSGYVYSDKFVSDEDALNEFKKYLMSEKMAVPRTYEEVEKLQFKNIKMRVGIHKRTFVKNVVAIGLSAGFIEPLESNGLFSVHEFLLKLVDILQRGELNQFDKDMYNVSVKDMFDDFSKFVALHYALSHRNDTQYWKEIQEKEFSDSTGDPYMDYEGKTATFYNMSWRYMKNWGHPESIPMAGITFISTGMNLFMINENRFNYYKKMYGENLENDIEIVINRWNKRKYKWEQEAKKQPSLYLYLKNNFYND